MRSKSKEEEEEEEEDGEKEKERGGVEMKRQLCVRKGGDNGPPKRVERSLQSLRMPIERHFCRRQYWQRLRWCLVTSQSLPPRHV